MQPTNTPRLRTVEKVKPLYPLNNFPKNFGYNVGKEIVYLLTTKENPSLEGEEWEQIFANCINAEWKPSNVGLDDIILESCAWGAKTIKSSNPLRQKKARLISGRNSPIYSFGTADIPNSNPSDLGKQILDIWNERVSAIRQKYKHLRTIVLIKSNDLCEVVVFEFETIRYDSEQYNWRWNSNGNLEGLLKSNNDHRFTWQPHGSQFTILENVPEHRLYIKIKKPKKLNKEQVLKTIGFDKSWIIVEKK